MKKQGCERMENNGKQKAKAMNLTSKGNKQSKQIRKCLKTKKMHLKN